MYKYLFPFLGVLIETFSDVLLKFYIQSKKTKYLYLGIFGYTLTGLFFVKLLELHNLGTSNVIWHVTHFIFLFIISLLYFKEKYTNKELLGIFFGFLSLYFASHKHH